MKALIGLWVLMCGASALAQPALEIEVAYREPASSFEIIDNVSDWWPGYTEPEYRTFWADSLGISTTDSVFFREYKILREKYFDRTGQDGDDPGMNSSGLFTNSAILAADPVAHAFYQSETYEEAFELLAQFLQPQEVVFLRSFFDNFSERLSALAQEGAQVVAGSLARTRQSIDDPEVAAYLDDLAGFVGVDESVHFTALYVWWPDPERVRASPNGPFLLIRLRPFAGETANSADVVVHEAVHALMAEKPNEQKKQMSGIILASCPRVLDYTTRLGVMEEPLATILGNIEFRRRFEPARFSWGRQWYGDQWVDLMARLLYPVVMEAMAAGRPVEQVVADDAVALLRVGMKALQPNGR